MIREVAYFYGPPCTCSGGIVQLQVLKSVFDLLPDARVEAVVIDFEAATWRAFHRLRPDLQLRGCFFHYAQAVWRHIQQLGLLFQRLLKCCSVLYCSLRTVARLKRNRVQGFYKGIGCNKG